MDEAIRISGLQVQNIVFQREEWMAEIGPGDLVWQVYRPQGDPWFTGPFRGQGVPSFTAEIFIINFYLVLIFLCTTNHKYIFSFRDTRLLVGLVIYYSLMKLSVIE